MKAAKVLLIGLLVSILLLVGIIVLYYFKPELFDGLKKKEEPAASTVSAVDAPVEEEPSTEAAPVSENTVSEDEPATEEPPVDPNFAEDMPEAGLRTGLDTSYDPGSEEQGDVPKELKDLTGLTDLHGSYDILDRAKADEIASSLSTGPTGDNLEFDELFYPYYHMLDDPGQKLYRQIYANARELNPDFKSVVTKMPWSSLKNVFEAVFNDNPELFWLNTEFSAGYRDDGDCLEIKLSFNPTAQDLEGSADKFNRGAENIGNAASGDEYEQEKNVHNAIVDDFSYSLSAEMNQSAYSGFVNKSTVCAGYARCFQYIMQNLGIPCYYCRGIAGEPHAWNIIKLGDDYYNVDATWDDASGVWQYEYFNLSDDDIKKDHRRTGLSVYLPACRGGQYSDLEKKPEEPSEEASSESKKSSDNDSSSDDKKTDDKAKEENKKQEKLPEGTYVDSLEDYYRQCRDIIKEKGKGTYSFDLYTSDKSVYNNCMQAYVNGGAKSGYMNDVYDSTEDAKGMSVEFVGNEDGGAYKMTQKVRLW